MASSTALKTSRLAATLAAVCPIISVAVGKTGDSSTVTLIFDPTATPAQQATAQSTLTAFDWTDTADTTWLDQQHTDYATIRDQATSAVTNNNTYLALVSPTNAQNIAQLQALTQQNNKIIKALAKLAISALN